MSFKSGIKSSSGTIQSGHVSYYVAAFVALVVLGVVLRAAYRVFLHPLKKFPGPKLAALSNIPYLYYIVTGQDIPWICGLHERYGEVVRYTPEGLSYINPQAWKDIAGHRVGGRPELSKEAKRFYIRAPNGEHNVLTEPSTQIHSQTRRVFSHAFSDKALKLQEPLIRNHVNKLKRNINKAIAENPEVSFDVVKLYNFTTFDIMGDLTFGEPLGMLDTGKYTPWVETVFQNIKASALSRIARFYPPIGAIFGTLMLPSMRGKRLEHFQHSAERVDKRLEKGVDVDKSDIWKLVLQNQTIQLPVPVMHANASLFMIAGTETTATLLSGLTYLLLKNPDKMKRVVAEVRALPEEDLSIDALPRLKYLNACFEEALRCYPPVPAGLPREVPKGGAAICGEWVSEGAYVAVSQKAAYSSPLNFRDAEKFIPERWLPDTGYDTDRKDVFQPFSYGPRNCLGKNLAYHEMRVIGATILWNYDLELCPESNNWMNQKCFTLWDKPALIVKLKPVRY